VLRGMNGIKKRREEERKWFTGVCLLKMVFFLYSLEGIIIA
jgi:hypothetical protein